MKPTDSNEPHLLDDVQTDANAEQELTDQERLLELRLREIDPLAPPASARAAFLEHIEPNATSGGATILRGSFRVAPVVERLGWATAGALLVLVWFSRADRGDDSAVAQPAGPEAAPAFVAADAGAGDDPREAADAGGDVLQHFDRQLIIIDSGEERIVAGRDGGFFREVPIYAVETNEFVNPRTGAMVRVDRPLSERWLISTSLP